MLWFEKEAERLAEKTAAKDMVIFETGFGPSGLPHIGTIAEVIRTSMVRKQFEKITGKSTKLIVFSDNLDGLRKAPLNVPNRDLLETFISSPVYYIPDPFDCNCDSFSGHNERQLVSQFLPSFGFENARDFIFMKSSDCYNSGQFNDSLRLIADNIEKILQIILPTLKNRKDSYCPFLPIIPHQLSNKLTVIQDVFDWEIDDNYVLHFATEKGGQKRSTSIFDGDCKLQWKVDWAMRWIALNVDYEMHGKDLLDSAQIGDKFCHALGIQPPQHLMYELFLDEEGKKISKSIGNGLEVEHWGLYSPKIILQYFLAQNPVKARKLHWDIIPQTTDQYLKELQNGSVLIEHLHSQNIPTVPNEITFGMLLNLAEVANSDDPLILRSYIENYDKSLIGTQNPLLDDLIASAINYFKDLVIKEYKIPSETENECLRSLLTLLEQRYLDNNPTIPEQTPEGYEFNTAEEIQYWVYEIGKTFYGEKNLRDYFQMIYEVLFGKKSGPRFGTFIHIVGVEKVCELIESKL